MADHIPEEIITHVRNAASIVDVVSEYVMLKKAGRNFMGLCPFHTEKTPSFTVSEEKQIFHCFGCGQGGNVFTFLMQYNNLTFPEAVGFLAKKYGIRMPSRRMSAVQEKVFQEKESLFSINKEAVDFFRSSLRHPELGKRAQKYLDARGMTPEITQGFLLGYAPDAWTDLLQYFTKRGVSVSQLEKVGLVVSSRGRHYDRFRDRIIFPIADIQGKILGFGGRSLGEDMPKYLNSPDTPIYHKGQTLYGLQAAKDACRQNGTVFIVEGYFDLLALHCRGIRNVVATLGTALTQQHVRIMKGYAREMILVFDSDDAGIKAAERSLPIFMQEKVDPKIVILPAGNDPDSYVAEVGREVFLKTAESAAGAMPFLITSAIQKHGLSLEGRVRVVEALKNPLGSLSDSVSRSVYIRDLAERLDIDESAILERVRTCAGRESHSASAKKPAGGSRLEAALLSILLKCPDMHRQVDLEEILEGLEASKFRAVGRMIMERFNAKQPVAGADLIARTDDQEMRNLISSLLMEDVGEDHESYSKILKQYKASRIKQQIRQLSKKIKEAEKANDQELLSELLAEKQKWAQQQTEACQL